MSTKVHIIDMGNVYTVEVSYDELMKALEFYRKEKERHRIKSHKFYLSKKKRQQEKVEEDSENSETSGL